MATDWTFWRKEQVNPTPPERRDDRPTDHRILSGYYRLEGAKTKPDWPVVIWNNGESDATVFQIGNKRMDTATNAAEWDDFAASAWLKCIAVTKAEWDASMERGFWSDGKPARHMDEAEKHGIDLSAGDNAAPLEETLADQIAALAKRIDATPEPSGKEAADTLSGLLDKLRTLLKLAEAERVKEKEPHLQASREVDAKWKAIGEPGGDAYRKGDERRKTYLRKEQARLDAAAAAERKRLQDIADEENERIRRENQKRMDEAQDFGGFDPSDPTDRQPELLPEVAAPEVVPERAKAGTAFGRSSGLKKVKVAYVDDPAALAKHFIETSDADFSDYLQRRAAAALRAKVVLPGCGSREELQ